MSPLFRRLDPVNVNANVNVNEKSAAFAQYRTPLAHAGTLEATP
jgi:hypothetical protein